MKGSQTYMRVKTSIWAVPISKIERIALLRNPRPAPRSPSWMNDSLLVKGKTAYIRTMKLTQNGTTTSPIKTPRHRSLAIRAM